MGFAVWVDEKEQVVWAQGTHEYRPMGSAVIAITDRFQGRDFRQSLKRPRSVDNQFVGFFGSLESVNDFMQQAQVARVRSFRPTPAHLI